MLVISRRKGQRVTIGDDIEIVVTAVHKNGVKLGISAPRGFTVLRGEVRDAIFSANLDAARSTVTEAVAVVAETPSVKRTPVPAARLALRRQSGDAPTSQGGDAPSEPARPGAPSASEPAKELP